MTTTMKTPVRRRHHVLRLGAVTVRTSRRAVITVTLMLAGVLLTALLAVGLGKYYLFPLAAAGQAGVERALDLMRTEVIRDMRLMGCARIDQLSRSNLRFRS